MEKEKYKQLQKGEPGVYPQLNVYNCQKPCKSIVVTQMVIYSLSFILTWSDVWWDTLVGLIVSFIGYYATRDPFHMKKINFLYYYYYGCWICICLHAIAFGVAIYNLIAEHIKASVFHASKFGSTNSVWAFYIIMLIVLTINVVSTVIGIIRADKFVAELLGKNYTDNPYAEIDSHEHMNRTTDI